jgi:hypothetical protein
MTQVLEPGHVISPARPNLLRELVLTLLTHGNLMEPDVTPDEVLASLSQHHTSEDAQKLMATSLASLATELTIGDFFYLASQTVIFHEKKREEEARQRHEENERRRLNSDRP